VADFLWFVDDALAEMADILRSLGDDLVNRRPDPDGANSAYAIVTHCLGVMEYWGGATVADRQITRHRAAEFTAEGEVEPLLANMTAARATLEADLRHLDAMAAPHQRAPNPKHQEPFEYRQGAVLVHLLRELFQHLGHLELTRDVVQVDS
jgi:hypothetical protein